MASSNKNFFFKPMQTQELNYFKNGGWHICILTQFGVKNVKINICICICICMCVCVSVLGGRGISRKSVYYHLKWWANNAEWYLHTPYLAGAMYKTWPKNYSCAIEKNKKRFPSTRKTYPTKSSTKSLYYNTLIQYMILCKNDYMQLTFRV